MSNAEFLDGEILVTVLDLLIEFFDHDLFEGFSTARRGSLCFFEWQKGWYHEAGQWDPPCSRENTPRNFDIRII